MHRIDWKGTVVSIQRTLSCPTNISKKGVEISILHHTQNRLERNGSIGTTQVFLNVPHSVEIM